jgi:hypothetical protein
MAVLHDQYSDTPIFLFSNTQNYALLLPTPATRLFCLIDIPTRYICYKIKFDTLSFWTTYICMYTPASYISLCKGPPWFSGTKVRLLQSFPLKLMFKLIKIWLYPGIYLCCTGNHIPLSCIFPA